MRFSALIKLLLASAALQLAASASAAPITFKITGVVEGTLGNAQSLPDSIVAGVPFTALVTYDQGVADTNPDPTTGRFDHAPGLSSLVVDVNGAVFASIDASPAEIQVNNDWPPVFHIGFPPLPSNPGDAVYLKWSELIGPGEYDEVNSQLLLADQSGEALASDEIPTAIDAEAFSVRWLAIQGRRTDETDAYYGLSIMLRIDSISVVPEPSTLRLAAVGAVPLLTIGALRRRR